MKWAPLSAESSYTALLRIVLPKRADALREGQADSVQAATHPGQNSLEVYGSALVLVLFHTVWCADAFGSWLLAMPLAIGLIHIEAIASALLGSRLSVHYHHRMMGEAQGYLWPQRVQWGLLAGMAWFAVWAPLARTQWLAWPVLGLLALNLLAWFALRKWTGLGIIVLWHALAALVASLTEWLYLPLLLFPAHALILFDTLYPHSKIFRPTGVRRLGECGHDDNDGTPDDNRSARRKTVWLTIDDGPSKDDTAPLLELLDQHDAKATFFLIGERARQHPDDVRAIAARGHEVANHTFSHPAGSFWIYTPGAMCREIASCQRTLEQITGNRPEHFRSPVGFANPFLRPILEKLDLRFIGWTARGFDGVGTETAKALARLKRQIGPGSIILLHQGRPNSQDLLQGLLEWLDQEGFRCVLPNLFEKE